jgi:hypothetical protein
MPMYDCVFERGQKKQCLLVRWPSTLFVGKLCIDVSASIAMRTGDNAHNM